MKNDEKHTQLRVSDRYAYLLGSLGSSAKVSPVAHLSNQAYKSVT